MLPKTNYNISYFRAIVKTNKKGSSGVYKNSALEAPLTLVGEARELANKIRLLGALKRGANEETLTLDLFLGKEAL